MPACAPRLSIFHGGCVMVFDYRAELRNSLSEGDTANAMVCIYDMIGFLLEAFSEAARVDQQEIVKTLLVHTNLRCSGHLMEELLDKGLLEMAKLFVDRDRVWGSAASRYQDYCDARQN